MIGKLIFGIASLMVILGTAFGLECYECSGPKGQKHDCEVNLQNSVSILVKNCTEGFQCTTFVQRDGNQSKIHRLCGSNNECENIRALNTHGLSTNLTLDVESCYTCNTSLCNSAKYVFNSSMLSLTILSLVFVYSLIRF